MSDTNVSDFDFDTIVPEFDFDFDNNVPEFDLPRPIGRRRQRPVCVCQRARGNLWI